jgi:hypothetical protein
VAILALLLYAFWDLDRQRKKFQLMGMLDIASKLTALEGRMSSGALRSESECEENIAKYAQAMQEVQIYGKLKNLL